MKFYGLREIPVRSDDVVFKASPARLFVPLLIFLAIIIALLPLAIGGGKLYGVHHPPPALFVFAFVAFFGLFGFVSLGMFRASLKPTNWLLRCNGEGVTIKYRSFCNWRFPEEEVQAVGFDYSEIAWVRTFREKRSTP